MFWNDRKIVKQKYVAKRVFFYSHHYLQQKESFLPNLWSSQGLKVTFVVVLVTFPQIRKIWKICKIWELHFVNI